MRDMPPVPLFFTSIIRDRVEITDTNDEDEFVEFLSAGSLVGVQEASGDLQRFHRPMTHTFIGTMGQVKKELGVFAQAALCRSQLRSSTLGLLASYNEAMWSTYVDPYHVFMKAGPELRFLSVAQLTEKIGSVLRAPLRRLSAESRKGSGSAPMWTGKSWRPRCGRPSPWRSCPAITA